MCDPRTDGRTDGPTHGWMDTPSYRVVTHEFFEKENDINLEMTKCLLYFHYIFLTLKDAICVTLMHYLQPKFSVILKRVLSKVPVNRDFRG